MYLVHGEPSEVQDNFSGNQITKSRMHAVIVEVTELRQ